MNNYFGAPWVGANIDLLGRSETDHDLNARLVPEWQHEGLNYTTLSGNSHAWCSVLVNANMRSVGVKGTNSAAAASWSAWGDHAPFYFGSILDIKHYSGGRHVAMFLYWIDEANKICAQMGGNQGDHYSIVRNNLSGHGDHLVTGPRWPHGFPPGKIVSMAEVHAAYPNLHVGAAGNGSTR